MSARPTKRPHRPARLDGPTPEPGPAPACPIVHLALELLEIIVAHLASDDLYALASTAKAFWKTYHLRAVRIKLERCALYDYATQWDGESWNPTLFCLSNAKAGQVGWSPFLLVIVKRGDDEILLLEAVSPTFMRFAPDEPTEGYLCIQHTEEYVEIKEDYFSAKKSVGWEADCGSRFSGDWDAHFAGRLVRATPALLESRFTCPECRGAREINIGDPHVTKRWPLLSSPYQYDIPCPRCRISTHRAIDIMEDIDSDIAEELKLEIEVTAAPLEEDSYDYELWACDCDMPYKAMLQDEFFVDIYADDLREVEEDVGADAAGLEARMELDMMEEFEISKAEEAYAAFAFEVAGEVEADLEARLEAHKKLAIIEARRELDIKEAVEASQATGSISGPSAHRASSVG
ncbi:hypothetical protein RQP46_009931 [Phenoliferia psychrophenolica]